MQNIRISLLCAFLFAINLQENSANSWIGTFSSTNMCNRTLCCCIETPFTIAKNGNTSATATLALSGNACPGNTTQLIISDVSVNEVEDVTLGKFILSDKNLILHSNQTVLNTLNCSQVFQLNTNLIATTSSQPGSNGTSPNGAKGAIIDHSLINLEYMVIGFLSMVIGIYQFR